MTCTARSLLTSAAATALAVGLSGTAQAHIAEEQSTEEATQQSEGVAAPAETTPTAQRQVASGSEIVVTATRREQSLQDVPISIEVLSGETLEDLGVTDFRSMATFVPNVNVQTTAGNHVIYVRGFGSPPSNYSFDQSVSLYIDGVYAGRSRQAMAPFFDVARVEVLRGPQGALFGKNTPAGAVSIVSAGPTNHFEAGLTASYSFDREGYDTTGYVSGPVSDTLAVRFAGRLLDQDGYIENLATGNDDPSQEMQMFRATARWNPSSSFDLTGRVEYGNQKVTGGISVASPLGTEQQPRLTRYLENSALGQEGITGRSVIASATANVEIGTHTLTSITGYSWFEASVINGFDQSIPTTGGHTANSVYNSYPERFDQFSQEVRLLSPSGGMLEYIVGAYYDQSKYWLTQLGGFNIAALNYFGLLRTNFHQTSSSQSVFGQVTFRPMEALRVIGSLRYTHTDKEGEFDGELVYGPFALRPVNTTAVGEISESELDPSITVQYDISRDVMVYATYGEGSKSGGFVSNTYGTTNATFAFRPERSRNYEAGFKAQFLDRRLLFNASFYNTQFSDLQVSIYNPILQIYQTGNAAKATAKGVEGQIVWNVSDFFDIQASGAYNDLTFDDYPGAACLAIQPLSECNPADPASIAKNNLAGYSPVNYSKWSGSVQAHVRIPIGDDLQVDATGVASGRSRFYNADNQDPVFGYQPGYIKYDLRLEVSPPTRRWHVALVGRNLTNELTTGSSFFLPSPITAAPRAILYVEPPRNLSIEVGFRF